MASLVFGEVTDCKQGMQPFRNGAEPIQRKPEHIARFNGPRNQAS